MKVIFNEQNWQQLQKMNGTYRRDMAVKHRSHVLQIPKYYQFIGDKALCNNMKVRSLKLPEACAIIGHSAFEGSQIEREIILPQTMKVIGRKAFAHTPNLRKMFIPKSVKRVGEGAFRECKKLKKVVFERDSQLRVLREGVFDSCTGMVSMQFPDHLQRIERRALYRCKQLTDAELPPTVRYIGEEAFYFTMMDHLNLPMGLVEIGDSAFFKCGMLTEVSVPPSVRRIGRWVFHGCNRLKILEILHDPDMIGEWIINRSATIRCRKGSAVDEYCREYGFKTEYV